MILGRYTNIYLNLSIKCKMASATSGESSSSVNYNKLKKEKSPYLLQHAANPVDW